mmetsp:Transcript_17287/g.55495  ORF Transcript_17287/g.55495 Transcript_17287/m.55495 type:complete len:279 (+) Transcript_17287:879-1715(+)
MHEQGYQGDHGGNWRPAEVPRAFRQESLHGGDQHPVLPQNGARQPRDGARGRAGAGAVLQLVLDLHQGGRRVVRVPTPGRLGARGRNRCGDLRPVWAAGGPLRGPRGWHRGGQERQPGVPDGRPHPPPRHRQGLLPRCRARRPLRRRRSSDQRWWEWRSGHMLVVSACVRSRGVGCAPCADAVRSVSLCHITNHMHTDCATAQAMNVLAAHPSPCPAAPSCTRCHRCGQHEKPIRQWRQLDRPRCHALPHAHHVRHSPLRTARQQLLPVQPQRLVVQP